MKFKAKPKPFDYEPFEYDWLEAIEHLEKAKEYVARGFVTENRAIFKRFFSALGEAFQTIGEMIGGLFDD